MSMGKPQFLPRPCTNCDYARTLVNVEGQVAEMPCANATCAESPGGVAYRVMFPSGVVVFHRVRNGNGWRWTDKPPKTRVRELAEAFVDQQGWPSRDRGAIWLEAFSDQLVEAVKDYLDRNFRDRQDAINNLRREFLEPR